MPFDEAPLDQGLSSAVSVREWQQLAGFDGNRQEYGD